MNDKIKYDSNANLKENVSDTIFMELDRYLLHFTELKSL